MAITIINTPRTVDFGKNQLGFKISNDRGRSERFLLDFYAAPAIGKIIKISWADKTIQFEVVAAADNSGTQLTSTTDTSVINTDLMKNTLFANDWELSSMTSTLLCYWEKDILNYFNVEILGYEESFNPTYRSKKFYDPQYLVSELFLKQYGDVNFVSQGLSFYVINFDNLSYINLFEKVLKGFKPYLPTFKANQVTEIVNTLYYMKIWEYMSFGGTMFQNGVTTGEFIALNGKLPVSEFVNFAWPTPFYLLSENTAWRDMWSSAHNELTLLITGSIATFDLKVKLYFDDETDVTVAIATVTCAQNKTYFIPAGFEQLPIAINTPEGLTCYRYEVIIANGTDSISRSFIVKDAPDLGKVFRFMNSLGGWDCLPVLGYKSAKKKVEQIATEKSLTPFYTETTNLQSVKYNPTEEYEVNVLSLTTAESIMFKQLLDSPFVYLEEDSSFKLIIITSPSIDVFDEENDLHNAKLSFRYA